MMMKLIENIRGGLNSRAELKRVLIILAFVLLICVMLFTVKITGLVTYSYDQSCMNDSDCWNISNFSYCLNGTCVEDVEEEINLIINETNIILENLTLENLTLENETNVTIDNGTFNEALETENFKEETTQEQAIIGQPVRWNKKITIENPDAKEIRISLPKEAENIGAEKVSSERGKIRLETIVDSEDISGDEVKIVEKEDVKEVLINATSKEYEISYETPAPESFEESVSKVDKIVLINASDEFGYTNILAYSKLPYEISNEEVYLYHILGNDKENVEFTLQDTDENGLYDQISWIVSHLSNQTYEIIIITKAEHLDENYTFVSDIYNEVRAFDSVWSEEIPSEHYVRVTFQKNLTSLNDITIFSRKISGNPRIEVYEKDGKDIIAEFKDIKDNEYNKVLLTNLKVEQDTFDLKVLDGGVEFDHIVDPIPQYTGGLLVYSDGDIGVPKYRTFDGTSFGSEQNATSVGSSAIEWIRVAACPIRDEWIIATRDAGDIITAQVCTGAGESISCGVATNITITAGTHGWRNYDVAYEMLSGEAILVYGTATADELRKVEWNGNSWVNDEAVTTTQTSGTVFWVELTSRNNSDQIGIVYTDSAFYDGAYRWNGTAITDEANSQIRSYAANNVRKADVAFEGVSGDMLVIASHSSAGRLWVAQLSGTTWTISEWVGGSPFMQPTFVDIAEGDSSIDKISITATSTLTGTALGGASWDGGAMAAGTAIDTSMTTYASNYHLATVSYLSSTYLGVDVYSDSGVASDDINWYTMDSVGTWTQRTDNLRTRGVARHLQLYDYPTADKVLLITDDANSDLWADTWDGANVSDIAWTDLTGTGALETSLTSATRQQFDFAFRLAPVMQSIGASFGTNPIDNYNSSNSSITFDVGCASDVAVDTIQLWTDTTGTWQANYSNSSYTNNTWLNVTVNGISEAQNYKWAVYCNDTSSKSYWTGTNRTFAVDKTNPLAEFGANPIDNYNTTNSSIAFDLKCSDNFGVSTIQLWSNWTGTWSSAYTNSIYTNNTWLNITLEQIPRGTNHKWAVYCNDAAGNSNITINKTIYNISYDMIGLSSCNDLISANTFYFLTQNISSVGTCINIFAPNITLDCNGFAINYSNPVTGYGVYSNSSNTTLKNCVIFENNVTSYGPGIYYAAGSGNGTIYNNNITTLGTYSHGIYLTSSSKNNITNNNIMTNSSYSCGINVSSSSNNNLTNNQIMTNGSYGYGIQLSSSSNNSLINSTITTNSNSGTSNYGVSLSSSSNNSLINSTIITRRGTGVILSSLSNNNYFIDNHLVLFGVQADGISISSGSYNNITNNNIFHWGSSGCSFAINLDYSNNSVLNNNIMTNGSCIRGIYMSSSNSRAIGNIITLTGSSSFDYGVIFIDGNSNIVADNIIQSTGGTSHGISFSGSNNNLTNNSVFTNGSESYGIYFSSSGSNNNLTNNNIRTTGSSAYGIYFSSSGSTNNSIKDTLIDASSSGVADIYSSGTGINNFTNCTFVDKSVTSTGKINVLWYADVYANDTNGNPIDQVNVTIKDVNNLLQNWTLTNISGYTIRLALREYMQNSTGMYFDTNYNFSGDVIGGGSNTTQVNLTGNRLAGINPITLTLLGPRIRAYFGTNPIDNENLTNSSVVFGMKCYDGLGNVSWIQLWTNTTGTWHANYSNSSYLPDTWLNITVAGIQDNLGYKWAVWCNNTESNVSWTDTNRTFTVDTLPPVAESGTNPIDNSKRTSSSVVFDIKCFDNLAIYAIQLWTNTTGTWQANYSNSSYTNNTWLNVTVNGIPDSFNYKWAVYCNDTAGNSNTTLNRTLNVDTTAPKFYGISWYPNTLSDVDPNVTLLFNATVNDSISNISSVLLRYYNGSEWRNVSMILINDSSRLYLVNFTTQTTEANYTINIWANDTAGNENSSANQTINSLWDCNWSLDSYDLGAFAGWDENKFLNNLTIINTGDPLYSNNNCTLDFRLTYDLAEGRIYLDGDYVKPSATKRVAAKSNLSIQINATFLSEIRQDEGIITTKEVYQRSITPNASTDVLLISLQGGPYLYEEIESYPTLVYLTPQNIALESYLRNLMGSDVENETNTAYNVTFNWSLPSVLSIRDGNQNLSFTNITDSDPHRNNVNIAFTDLTSMSPGTQRIYLYAQGYNLTGDLIKDIENNTLFNKSLDIIFLCYTEPDDYPAMECWPSDPDTVFCGNDKIDADETCESCVWDVGECQQAPGIEGSGGSGGGGFSGGQAQKVFQTSERYELLRGKDNKFIVTVENPFAGATLENVTLNVSGFLAQYLLISPDLIERIGINESKTFTVKITAPNYFEVGFYDLTFYIKGVIKVNSTISMFSEKREVSLDIHDVSRAEVLEFLNKSQNLIQEMNQSKFYVENLISLYKQEQDMFKKYLYENAKSTYVRIKDLHDKAYYVDRKAKILEKDMISINRDGIQTPETLRLLSLTKVAFSRGDYDTAMSRIKEAELSYALETKGEFSFMRIIKKNWLALLITIISLALLAYVLYMWTKYALIKQGIRRNLEEERILIGLMKVIQGDCFDLGKMSMGEYQDAMQQYELKLNKTTQNLIELETKKAHFFWFDHEDERLRIERERLLETLKETQKLYFERGKLETRIYETKLRSYASRLSDVEERLALIEAQKALKMHRFLSKKNFKKIKVLRVPEPKRRGEE